MVASKADQRKTTLCDCTLLLAYQGRRDPGPWVVVIRWLLTLMMQPVQSHWSYQTPNGLRVQVFSMKCWNTRTVMFSWAKLSVTRSFCHFVSVQETNEVILMTKWPSRALLVQMNVGFSCGHENSPSSCVFGQHSLLPGHFVISTQCKRQIKWSWRPYSHQGPWWSKWKPPSRVSLCGLMDPHRWLTTVTYDLV